jgi:hypothetical protein
MALHKKVEPLMALRPDIAIIPECDNPEIVKKKASRFEFNDAVWIKKSRNKGLGVFTFGSFTAAKSPLHSSEFELFLPVKISGQQSFNLLAVWDFHYRSKLPAHQNGAGTRAALRHYQEFISEEPSIVAGDFNNNVLWDKRNRDYDGNFSHTVNDLERLGFVSAYHQFENCVYGKEPEPTLYWRMSKTQVYHIDYCFVSHDLSMQLKKVTVGVPEPWLHFSDHVPLVVEVEL